MDSEGLESSTQRRSGTVALKGGVGRLPTMQCGRTRDSAARRVASAFLAAPQGQQLKWFVAAVPERLVLSLYSLDVRKIAVCAGTPAWMRAPGAVPAAVQRGCAGFHVRVDEGNSPAQPVAVDVGQALAWAEHKIKHLGGSGE
jgi:hypothetical protein